MMRLQLALWSSRATYITMIRGELRTVCEHWRGYANDLRWFRPGAPHSRAVAATRNSLPSVTLIHRLYIGAPALASGELPCIFDPSAAGLPDSSYPLIERAGAAVPAGLSESSG